MVRILFFIFFSLLFFACQKSYKIINHGEIQSAYRANDFRYIPNLKVVVEKYNRDLGTDAILQLGNYYRDLAFKLEDRGIDSLSQEERKVYLDLENYFISNATINLDFNMKNIIYRNLMFSSHPQVWKIYENILNSPVIRNNNNQNNPERENIAAVLGFIGERRKWLGNINLDKSLFLCKLGINSPDTLIFMAGLNCWSGLYKNFPNPENRSKLMEYLTEYQEKIKKDNPTRYYLIFSYLLITDDTQGA